MLCTAEASTRRTAVTLRLQEPRCFSGLPGVKVSEMEVRRKGKSYTYDTVCEIQKQHPKAALTLIIGTDMFCSFEEWYHFESNGKGTTGWAKDSTYWYYCEDGRIQ